MGHKNAVNTSEKYTENLHGPYFKFNVSRFLVYCKVGKSLLELTILILFFNYNNNAYIVPISTLLFSSALKNKNI